MKTPEDLPDTSWRIAAFRDGLATAPALMAPLDAVLAAQPHEYFRLVCCRSMLSSLRVGFVTFYPAHTEALDALTEPLVSRLPMLGTLLSLTVARPELEAFRDNGPPPALTDAVRLIGLTIDSSSRLYAEPEPYWIGALLGLAVEVFPRVGLQPVEIHALADWQDLAGVVDHLERTGAMPVDVDEISLKPKHH